VLGTDTPVVRINQLQLDTLTGRWLLVAVADIFMVRVLVCCCHNGLFDKQCVVDLVIKMFNIKFIDELSLVRYNIEVNFFIIYYKGLIFNFRIIIY